VQGNNKNKQCENIFSTGYWSGNAFLCRKLNWFKNRCRCGSGFLLFVRGGGIWVMFVPIVVKEENK